MEDQNKEDPLISYKEFFNIRNHEETDLISSLYVGEQHIVSHPHLLEDYRNKWRQTTCCQLVIKPNHPFLIAASKENHRNYLEGGAGDHHFIS